MNALRWRQKPRYGTRIDWSHPLAEQLAGAWCVNEDGGLTVYNAATGSAASTNNGTLSNTSGANPTWVKSGQYGSALAFSAVNQGYVNCGSFAALNGTSRASLFGTGTRTTSKAWIFGRSGAGSTVRFQVQLSSSNAPFFFVDTGAGQAYLTGGSAPTTAFSTGMSYDGTLASGSRIAAYINGTTPAGLTLTGTPPTTLPTSTNIFGWSDSVAARYNDGTADVGYLWIGRALATGEHADLDANPWLLWEPPRSFFFVGVVSATFKPWIFGDQIESNGLG